MLFKLENFSDHPIHSEYLVFQYYQFEMAQQFQQEIEDLGIEFEKDFEQGPPAKHLFGIHKKHGRVVKEINQKILQANRKPFIPNKAFRIFVLLFTLSLVTIGIIGYIKNA